MSNTSKNARPQAWDNVTRWVMGIRDLDADIDWQAINAMASIAFIVFRNAAKE